MQHWKKIALSTAVILTFIAYSFQQRYEASKASPIAPIASNTPPTTSNQPASNHNKPASSTPTGKYKNGKYTGDAYDAYYGYIQVQIVVTAGSITDVVFIDHPNDNPESRQINEQAMPLLKQEAITAQSADVNGVSGATDTSMAFVQSLQSAISKAM